MTDIPAPAPAKLTAEEIADQLLAPVMVGGMIDEYATRIRAANYIREQERARIALVQERDRLLREKAALRSQLGYDRGVGPCMCRFPIGDSPENDGEPVEVCGYHKAEPAAPPAADAKETGR